MEIIKYEPFKVVRKSVLLRTLYISLHNNKDSRRERITRFKKETSCLLISLILPFHFSLSDGHSIRSFLESKQIISVKIIYYI